MSAQPLFSLAYLPLLIRLECLEAARLPAFLGSTLHGIVGWTLHHYAKSAYIYLFENKRFGESGQDIVNPYMIEPPRTKTNYRAGDLLTFKLFLFGDAIKYAEPVVRAFAQANRFEVGAERKAFVLKDVRHGEQYEPIFQDGLFYKTALTPENIARYDHQEVARWCSVHLLTPVRIRRGGELVKDVTFPTLIRGITRRVQLLTERYGGAFDLEAATAATELAGSVQPITSALILHEMYRYSSRKKESVDWSGMLGVMTFEGELSAFTPWLNVARILHIGRNSTFGCGQIDVVYR